MAQTGTAVRLRYRPKKEQRRIFVATPRIYGVLGALLSRRQHSTENPIDSRGTSSPGAYSSLAADISEWVCVATIELHYNVTLWLQRI